MREKRGRDGVRTELEIKKKRQLQNKAEGFQRGREMDFKNGDGSTGLTWNRGSYGPIPVLQKIIEFDPSKNDSGIDIGAYFSIFQCN